MNELVISLGGSLKLVMIRNEGKPEYLSNVRVERINSPIKQEKIDIFLHFVKDSIYSSEKTYVSSISPSLI